MGLQDVEVYLRKGINAVMFEKLNEAVESLSRARQLLGDYLSTHKPEEASEIHLLRDNGWEFVYNDVHKGNIVGGLWRDPVTQNSFKTKMALKIQRRRITNPV